MPEQAVSLAVVDGLATYPSLRRPPSQRPGPFAWKVTVPPSRDRASKVVAITDPFFVRGSSRYEASIAAAILVGDSASGVPKRPCRRKLPRGTQITRARPSSALVDLRSSRSEFSVRFG